MPLWLRENVLIQKLPLQGQEGRETTPDGEEESRGWVESEPRQVEPHGGRCPVARVLWAALKVPGAERFACVPTASGALYSLSNVYMGPINSVHSVTRCDKGSPHAPSKTS